jgi:hypothetical protein
MTSKLPADPKLELGIEWSSARKKAGGWMGRILAHYLRLVVPAPPETQSQGEDGVFPNTHGVVRSHADAHSRLHAGCGEVSWGILDNLAACKRLRICQSPTPPILGPYVWGSVLRGIIQFNQARPF